MLGANSEGRPKDLVVKPTCALEMPDPEKIPKDSTRDGV